MVIDVLLAQEILGSRGYYTGELDKGFGPLMETATKSTSLTAMEPVDLLTVS